MGKLIAIGGGNNGGDFDKQLEETIRHFIPKKQPKVIFIPYASNEYEDNFQEFKDIYETLGCEVNLLQPGKENMILQSDLIYIGRGWTIPLLEKLIETQASTLLSKALENGAIVAGFSAGAHALFNIAGSKEEGIGYTLIEGLGFINACMISHYNYEDRADAFHQLLFERKLTGIGLEGHTMLVVENNIAKIYSTKSESKGYIIKTGDSTPVICPINDEEFVLPLLGTSSNF